jgi:hypothetical protein
MLSAGNNVDSGDNAEGNGDNGLGPIVLPDRLNGPSLPNVGGNLNAVGAPNNAAPDQVLGERISRAGSGPAVAAAAQAAPDASGGVLPFTGANLIGFILSAAGLIGTGGYFMAKKRHVTE